MDIRKINDSISVSPQIKLEDAHELARLGFKSIISNGGVALTEFGMR